MRLRPIAVLLQFSTVADKTPFDYSPDNQPQSGHERKLRKYKGIFFHETSIGLTK